MNEAARALFYLQTSPVVAPSSYGSVSSAPAAFELPASSYVDRSTTRSMTISSSPKIKEEDMMEDEERGPGSALLALLNLNRLCPGRPKSLSQSSDESSTCSDESGAAKSPESFDAPPLIAPIITRDRSASMATVEKRFSSEAMSISQNKIGHYSLEERRRLIDRFLQKRHRRIWRKRVKYDVRKSFADSRLRVKGRFVRKEDEDQLRELLILSF